MHLFLYGLGRPYVVTDRHGHRAYLMDHRMVISARDMEGIDSQPFQFFCIVNGIFDGHPIRLIIRTGQTDRQREIRPHLLTAVFHDLSQETEPVFS